MMTLLNLIVLFLSWIALFLNLVITFIFYRETLMILLIGRCNVANFTLSEYLVFCDSFHTDLRFGVIHANTWLFSFVKARFLFRVNLDLTSPTKLVYLLK